MSLHRCRVRSSFRSTIACLSGLLLLLAACTESDPTDPDPGGPDDVKGAVVLAFVAPPGRAEGQVALAPALEVEARDQSGKRLTNWSGPVLLSLKQNPGKATLGGTLTRTAVNGVARFDDLTINDPGNGYTLLATSGASNVESAPFDVGLAMAMVSAGNDYTCGVTKVGKAYCWGDNPLGVLSRDLAYSTSPVALRGGLTLASISAGDKHVCAVTTAGEAYCWGGGINGQLGNDGTSSSDIPVAVSGGLTFASVSAAFRHSCGVTTTGQGYCWGFGDEGQLGTGGPLRSKVPVPITGGLEFASISAGDQHSCGVTTVGRAYCWGWGSDGVLGNGTTTDSHAPVPVSGALTFSMTTVGALTSCGVTPGNLAYCWGGAGLAKGTGTDQPQRLPTPVSGDLPFAQVSTTGTYSCGVTTAGEAYCWGSNNSEGKLGNSSTADSPVPVAVAGGVTFIQITTGNHHACGVTPTGEVYCWGRNSLGQLGTGTNELEVHAAPELVYGTKQ